MIKKQYRIIGVWALALSISLPLTASAQTSYTEGQTNWSGGDTQQINQWRERSSALDASVEKLDSQAVSNLPLPILFGLTPDNLTRNFGDPRSNGRTHEGLDIMAPKDTPIVSPTKAVVLSTGNGTSSGLYVYTANPGGETFVYMHLNKIADIKAGDELAVGDLIGYNGNTGNASGGSPHLHFEIRRDNGATDPYPRFGRTFPLADKIEYLKNILDDADDANVLANLMISLYKKELSLAKTMNIALPSEIEKIMNSAPVISPAPVIATTSGVNLTLGSKGLAVTNLQKFLISKNIGTARKVIADGSFGPITKTALADYQASVGIAPAFGYYGPITRAYITKIT